MTKREFIQRCCIQMINEHAPYISASNAEDMAKELEQRGYGFDKEDTIVNIENGK